MGLQVLLAGQDITSKVQEMSIQIKDVLGQGAGVGGGSTGRAATAQFLTSMGPAATAVAAGTVVHTPQLVRMGEVRIFDATATCIFGGYAAKLEDMTEKTKTYTQIDCYDYWQELDRIQVRKLYTGMSDIAIIKDLFTVYAPWIDGSLLPTTATFNFPVKNFRAITLQKALVQITDITGFQVWIDPNKKAHYENPAQSATSPFSLSDTPNFVTSFAFAIDTYVVDDTAAINRVTFYGGKEPSSDFTQELKSQATGTNKIFVLAYYPRAAVDGKVHVSLNGGVTDLVLGFLLGSGVKNQFKSAGGLCDVLINADAHTLIFDVAPGSGANVTCRYRYEFPLNIQVSDKTSFQRYGQWFDGVISDDTIFDSTLAVGRCRTLLTEQSQGLVTGTAHCYKAGLMSGHVLTLVQRTRGINGSYIIQEVDTVPLGGGKFRYDITFGAWNFNFVDVLVHMAQRMALLGLTSQSSDNGADTIIVDIEQMDETLHASLTWTKTTHVGGTFYARATALSDGHDAYPGLFTISS